MKVPLLLLLRSTGLATRGPVKIQLDRVIREQADQCNANEQGISTYSWPKA